MRKGAVAVMSIPIGSAIGLVFGLTYTHTDTDHRKSNPPSSIRTAYYDSRIEGLVINEWQSANRRVIQLRLPVRGNIYRFVHRHGTDNQVEVNFYERYWGEHEFTAGDCALVWVRMAEQHNNKMRVIEIYDRRNLEPVPCDNYKN